MKKLLALTVAVVMAFSLAACGGSADPTPAPATETPAAADPTAAPAPAADPTEAPEAPAAEDIATPPEEMGYLTPEGLINGLEGELTFSAHNRVFNVSDPDQGGAYDYFSANYPNLKVTTFDRTNEGNTVPTLQELVASGQTPDMFVFDSGEASTLVSLGYPMSLDGYLAEYPEYTQTLIPSALGLNTINGSVYGVVWEFLPRAWQLNLDLFERYGVDVPDSNWTVADLVAINNQFVDKANGVSGVQGDQHVIIDQFLRAYDVNAEVWEEGDERPHSRYSQDPNSINAVQALYDLIYANDSQFTDAEKQSFGPEWNDYWVQGHVAFAPWPPWGSPLDPKTGGYNFKWKVLPPPQGPTGTRDAGAGSICLAISSTATKEKADLAFKFIMSMTTAHYIENADLVDLTGSTPVVSPAGFRADVIKLPTGIPPVNMQYETHPDNVEALAGFLEAAALQSQSRYGQIGVPNNALITDVVEGGGSIADMLVEYDNAKNIELGHTD